MRARSSFGAVSLLCVALGMIAGCGDDDDGDKPADGGSAGSSADSGGGAAGTTADAGIRPLGDGISGKACGDSSDCDGATCSTQVTGGTFLPIAAPGGYCTGPCRTDADCGSGGVCGGAIPGLFNGECFAGCTSDDDCRDEYLCITGLMFMGLNVPNTCRPKPATDQLEDGVAGKACTAAGDCPGGTCVTMRGGFGGMGGVAQPGGYCSGSCLEDSQCGEGGVCSPGLLQGMAGSCYERCSSDADCTRDGYRCRQVGTDIRGCDPFPDPLPDGNAGKACASDADCGGVSGTCRTNLPAAGGFGNFGRQLTAPEGYCSQRCDEDLDCGLGGVCVGAGLVSGTCFKPCDDPTDCRAGYTCEERAGGFMLPGGAAGDAGMSMALTVCAPEQMNDADAGL